MTSVRSYLSLRDRMLQQALMRVRPAPLATLIKRMVGVRRSVVTTHAGRFWVDPVSGFAAALSRGHYEPSLTFALWSLLQPGGTFLDVGANEGYFCVVASKLVGPSGRVIAVEPQARLRDVLIKNFELNDVRNVELLSEAISDQRGVATLHLSPDTNTGSTALHQSTVYKTPRTTVETTTLNDLLDKAGLDHVDLLKMDIEGLEYEAILGSPNVFRDRRIGALALELHPPALVARGHAPEEIASFLGSCGYRIDLRLEHSLMSSIWRANTT